MDRAHFIALACAALLVPSGAALAETKAEEIVGHWLTDKEESKIEISQREGKFFGKIVWLKEPKYEATDAEAGKVKHDRNNPDPALKDKPIEGLEILKNFGYSSDNLWDGGTVYDPENGKTYKCKMWLEEGKLKVRGYIGVSALGRSTTWTRAPKEK